MNSCHVWKKGNQKFSGKEMHIFYGKKTLLNTYVHLYHINIRIIQVVRFHCFYNWELTQEAK